MSGFDWGGDAGNDDESFADRPVELGEGGKWQEVATTAPPAQPRPQAQQRPVAPPVQVQVQAPVVEVQDEEETEEDFSSVLSDAKLRLAQGSLYELLMNNNLFQDLDVDPKAVKNVEREVKNFAKERMEIMLGMRQEQAAQSNAVISSPFNDLEVEALKALASAATKGATQSPEAQTFTVQAPLAKKSTLTPIGQSRPSTPKKVAPVAPKAQQRLPQTPAQPLNRPRSNVNVEAILAKEQVTQAELDATFQDDYQPLDKPLHEYTEQEMVERNRAASKRMAGKQSVKSTQALPMPSQEMINSISEQRAQAATSNPQMQSLMTLLTKK